MQHTEFHHKCSYIRMVVNNYPEHKLNMHKLFQENWKQNDLKKYPLNFISTKLTNLF